MYIDQNNERALQIVCFLIERFPTTDSAVKTMISTKRLKIIEREIIK